MNYLLYNSKNEQYQDKIKNNIRIIIWRYKLHLIYIQFIHAIKIWTKYESQD